MSYYPQVMIRINNREFRQVESINYTATRNEPQMIEFTLEKYHGLIDGDFNLGDSVQYYRGYGDELELRFTGYIEQVSNTQPFFIRAYDILHFISKQDLGIASYSGEDKDVINSIVNIDVDWKGESTDYPNLNGRATKGKMIRVLLKQHGKDYYITPDGETFNIHPTYSRENEFNKTITKDWIPQGTYNITDVRPRDLTVRAYITRSQSYDGEEVPPSEYVDYSGENIGVNQTGKELIEIQKKLIYIEDLYPSADTGALFEDAKSIGENLLATIMKERRKLDEYLKKIEELELSCREEAREAWDKEHEEISQI